MAKDKVAYCQIGCMAANRSASPAVKWHWRRPASAEPRQCAAGKNFQPPQQQQAGYLNLSRIATGPCQRWVSLPERTLDSVTLAAQAAWETFAGAALARAG